MSQNEPKISVIVPVYNVEKYLSKCINSILSQSYKNFELILVDDGSTDYSGKICDEYADRDKRVIVKHKMNAGVSAARNTGIVMASGVYVMFVDSDDYIDCKMLEEMISFGDKSDIIFSGLRYVSNDGRELVSNIMDDFKNISLTEYIKVYCLEADKKHISCGPYNKLFNKKIIEDKNIKFDEELSICEDGLFVTTFLSRCHSITNINQCYYNYVQYGTGTLMCKYNRNANLAIEKYYLAKINMLERAFVSNELIMNAVNREFMNRFIQMFIQIYTRSGLNFKEKYLAANIYFQNKTFRKLIGTHIKEISGKSRLWVSLFKASDKIGMLPLHLLCSVKYKG